jgi:hypothetical protein
LLRAIEPVLEVRGVLVAGSEVPNLLEAEAASTLVVSQDVDLAIPIAVHEDVKARLDQITRLVPSADVPSVWIPPRGRRAARGSIRLQNLSLFNRLCERIASIPGRQPSGDS